MSFVGALALIAATWASTALLTPSVYRVVDGALWGLALILAIGCSGSIAAVLLT